VVTASTRQFSAPGKQADGVGLLQRTRGTSLMRSQASEPRKEKSI